MAIEPSVSTTSVTVRPARDHCLAPGRAEKSPGTGRYGRMFDGLAPLRSGEAFFREQGRRAVAGELSAFVDRDEAGTASDAEVPAGWPFFAQFLAHDLTADRSALSSRAEVERLRNARTARLDLECVYGRGPAEQPYLVQRDDPASMLIGKTGEGRAEDLPRNPEGVALIGDQRNDVHQPIAQLHVAFLKAHNGLVDRLRADGADEADLFAEARRSLRWHLQWIVLHDYLPTLVGPELARAVLDGDRRWSPPGTEVALPVEFADAAFRYGHSQVRERYRLNHAMDSARLFPDLVGFGPVPDERVVDWSLLFDLRGRPPAPQRAKSIDGRLVPSLVRLPFEITGDVESEEHRSLAVRDLQRGVATGLPSGETVAAAMGQTALTAEEVGVRELGWTWETPLWFYVLKEAEVREGGDRLGPVGGRIVAEVLTTVIDSDPTAYRQVDPEWTPSLPSDETGFRLADLLAFSARTDHG